MNVMQLTYTLVYRIKKDSVKQIYETFSSDYEGRIISTINVRLWKFLEYYIQLFHEYFSTTKQSNFARITYPINKK